jgi:hypothetical protein
VTCFAGCPRAEVTAALDALGFTDDKRATTIRPDDYEKRIQAAQAEWDDAGLIPPHGSVEWYLRHRGITLPVPAVLRRWRNGFMAAVQQLDGVVTAIQTKSLARKPTTRGWLGSGAVQLAPPCNGELGLAEGVENALSATQLFNLPCWATLGAHRLGAINLPSCVRRVHLFVDNDDGGVSHRSIERAKLRYSNQLLHVRTHWPPDGQDWNDVLKGKQP